MLTNVENVHGSALLSGYARIKRVHSSSNPKALTSQMLEDYHLCSGLVLVCCCFPSLYLYLQEIVCSAGNST